MTDITFVTSLEQLHEVPDGATVDDTVYRAGGTDLQDRLRTSNAEPRIIDLTGLPGFADVSTADDGGLVIGAGVTVARLARDLAGSHPALALTCAGLATPQVRAVATIGGNLLQHTRCWYYRHPETTCLKSGGTTCPARDGRHLYGVAFDTSPCVHPHPSSVAMALLTYDATVTVSGGGRLGVEELLGGPDGPDGPIGSDGTRDHHLPAGEVLTTVVLPPALDGERAAYFRAISRFEAEWPLVEAVCRVQIGDDARVAQCGIAIGGVAPVPLRLHAAEDLLTGSRLDDLTIDAVCEAATVGANPLPETGYKVALIAATVREVLERVAAG
ncbi:MAG: FAD binding domain-containing protein [Terracoccus sp.]